MSAEFFRAFIMYLLSYCHNLNKYDIFEVNKSLNLKILGTNKLYVIDS